MRWLRRAGCAAGLGGVAAMCCGAAGVRPDTSTVVRTHATKKVVALSPWEQAEQGRDALEAIPEETRTRAQYARAMDAYRAIYHANPADVHAPVAVNAVAELLAEQGRGLHDAKSLKAAVGQYEFLRKQYPASSLGAQALLTEGQIEQDDLGDAAAARDKYKLLLKEHPKSEQVEEAKAGLASLEQGTGIRDQGKTVSVVRPPLPVKTAPKEVVGPAHRDTAAINGVQASGAKNVAAIQSGAGAVPASSVGNTEVRSGRRALVTGIRHWSTATYTRVAIDLGDNVTYEAARVPNPDRIYFDLHGAKLAQELVGKSFSVTDDGFLKKVRAAQYSDDVTRIVLDVNDVTEYSAFLLPNPYRLIIDIHGGKAAPAGVTIGATQRRADPAPTVPNTVAVKQAVQRKLPRSVTCLGASMRPRSRRLSRSRRW